MPSINEKSPHLILIDESQKIILIDLDLDLKVLFLDQKLVPPLRGPSLTYKFSGDK